MRNNAHTSVFSLFPSLSLSLFRYPASKETNSIKYIIYNLQHINIAYKRDASKHEQAPLPPPVAS